MNEKPLWQAAAEREEALRHLNEARGRMYAAQKQYSLAHDAYVQAMQRHRERTGDASYSEFNTAVKP